MAIEKAKLDEIIKNLESRKELDWVITYLYDAFHRKQIERIIGG